MDLQVELRGLGQRRLIVARQLHHADLQATNTRTTPEAVAPMELTGATVNGERLQAKLRPLSWNVLVTEAE
jgi:alpha-N-arabinofuranosidase